MESPGITLDTNARFTGINNSSTREQQTGLAGTVSARVLFVLRTRTAATDDNTPVAFEAATVPLYRPLHRPSR